MSGVPLGEIDHAWQERFSTELLQTLFRVSMVENGGQRTALVRSYEAIDAMLTLIALLSATSTETRTPGQTRRLCDELAKKIRRRIAEAQRQPAPFETIVPGELNS